MTTLRAWQRDAATAAQDTGPTRGRGGSRSGAARGSGDTCGAQHPAPHTPRLPLAQPRSLIGGHLLAAVGGYLVLAACGSSTWAAAPAGGLALGTMMISRTPHSPAAATAVIVVLQSPAPLRFLTLLLIATLLLVSAGIVAGLPKHAPRYPAYWW